MNDQRFQHLHDLMEKHHLEVIALNPASSLTYLTGLGFHMMERPTVLLYKVGHPPCMILPKLEAGKLSNSRVELLAFPYEDDPSTWQAAYDLAAAHLKINSEKIGVEANHFRVLESQFLQRAAPNSTILPAEEIFAELRIHKDVEEIVLMRQAVRIAQLAFIDTLPVVRAGVTEKEIAAELTIQMLRKEADSDLPFSPIVAAGPNSANPHAIPTDRPLELGDLVVIDWGAKFQGYCSDLTRTVAIQELSAEAKTIYRTVQEANAAGRAASRPGIRAGLVDDAARKVITDRGFGELFTHRTGHGLGMEEHEAPYIFAANELVLQPGMVYTVEPGIYLPGIGGVRIEDVVLITHEGSESLSDLSRDLLVL